MFGETYKIKEEEISSLVTKTKKIAVRNILLVLCVAIPFIMYSAKPMFDHNSPLSLISFLFPVLVIFLIMLRRRKKNSIEEIFRAYELTISEGSIHCKSMLNNTIQNVTIQFSEITKITHYVRGSILVIGTDLSHSFSIPDQIEKKEEVISKLSSICAIGDGKKEIRLYYLQRINMFLFILSALSIVTAENKILIGMAGLVVVYCAFLPAYFLLTTKKMLGYHKIINLLYLVMTGFVLVMGIFKIFL